MSTATSPPGSKEPLVVTDGLRVAFGELVAVRDISLELCGGDLLGLIGPNGAGKTTLLRAIAGLQPPTAGGTRVMGLDVFGRNREVRRHIGFAPDSPPVYEDLTVQDFLTFIGHSYGLSTAMTQERIDFWLEQVWLTDRRNDRIRNLSRGMRQRVTVARTLVPNPNVVLLDEPSAGLDPAGRIQFRNVLASLRDQGKALIVSSHILADLEEYCTHIAILEKGRILKFGSVNDLQQREVGRHRIRLTLAHPNAGLGTLLAEMDGVTEIEHVDGAWTFEYDDGAERAAELLRALVMRELPIASFGAEGESLEQMYLKSGVKQVD